MSQITDHDVRALESALEAIVTAKSAAALADPAARFVAQRVLSGAPVPQNDASRKALVAAITALS